MTRWTEHGNRTRGASSVAALMIRGFTLAVAVGAGRVDEATAELVLANLFPGTFGVFFRAAHAGREVLETVHVQSAAAITRWNDALALG